MIGNARFPEQADVGVGRGPGGPPHFGWARCVGLIFLREYTNPRRASECFCVESWLTKSKTPARPTLG
jgi:hypothetical protein